jgi:hypothetical protein
LFLKILTVREEKHPFVIGTVFRPEYTLFAPRKNRGSFDQLPMQSSMDATMNIPNLHTSSSASAG